MGKNSSLIALHCESDRGTYTDRIQSIFVTPVIRHRDGVQVIHPTHRTQGISGFIFGSLSMCSLPLPFTDLGPPSTGNRAGKTAYSLNQNLISHRLTIYILDLFKRARLPVTGWIAN